MKKPVKRSREVIEMQFPVMKEMYESGYSVNDIANYFCLSASSVHNTFNVMGYAVKPKIGIDESKLTYAENKQPILEKVIVDGKLYTDITPLLA